MRGGRGLTRLVRSLDVMAYWLGVMAWEGGRVVRVWGLFGRGIGGRASGD